MSERYNSPLQRIDQPAVHLEQAWEQRLRCGFAIVADTNEDFGMDPAFRDHLSDRYFDGGAACRDVVICTVDPSVQAEAEHFTPENFFEPRSV